ncbi:hypothetical protein LTR56_016063 [Elasticomyces elasticus]|nr:hypothetical protein LTR56_016063 [Elasticomyces elasticus]KAK3653795.1 hypothetical protein LTR22_011010 [Elasticomyces elasticus]KAK4915997.1 hypothetical protein LTR49_015908 [Elasticomyces elasticus]KAK5755379.1 hypothetical protein LTS12_014486 [Elasticomyces elasticus]
MDPEIERELRTLAPDMPAYDARLPPMINIMRMATRMDCPAHVLQQKREEMDHTESKMSAANSEKKRPGDGDQVDDKDEVETRMRAQVAVADPDFQEIIKALNPKPGQAARSPLLVLQHLVASVIMHGPLRAGGVHGSMCVAAEHHTTEADVPTENLDVEWRSCKAAATLVGLLTCPDDEVYSTRKFLSQGLGGLPTLDEMRTTPSASFPSAFRKAKALARKENVATVILVSFVDVHIFELAAKHKADKFTSLAHSFAIGIGPEGVVLWQAWGEHGYSLDQYIKRDGARLRTWQEAGDLVDRFDQLAQHKGKWDAKRNKLYQQCFEVDINSICGPEGPSKPIVPEYEAWVRLKVFEGVQFADLYKYSFQFL